MEYGWTMLRMIVVLMAVCALAYGMLRWGLRRFAPFDPDHDGRLEVVERLGVGPKQAVMVVRAGDSYWLVGTSESGMDRLGKIEPDEWEGIEGELDAP